MANLMSILALFRFWFILNLDQYDSFLQKGIFKIFLIAGFLTGKGMWSMWSIYSIEIE